MQRLAVRLRIHGYGLHVEFSTGANDAESDLAAVGDQDLFKHAVWWQGPCPAASPDGTNQVAALPCRKPSHCESLVPSTPWTRRVNSAGLVAWNSAFS